MKTNLAVTDNSYLYVLSLFCFADFDFFPSSNWYSHATVEHFKVEMWRMCFHAVTCIHVLCRGL